MIGETLCWLVNAYQLIVLAYVILSWVPRPPEPILPLVRGVRRAVDPVAAPLRRVIPPLRLGGAALDLSILVLFLGLYILQAVVCRLSF